MPRKILLTSLATPPTLTLSLSLSLHCRCHFVAAEAPARDEVESHRGRGFLAHVHVLEEQLVDSWLTLSRLISAEHLSIVCLVSTA